jgi:large subunit ribosomal protein L25
VKEGGVLTQVTTEVTVEALPMEVPEHLEADISEMQIGDTLRLSAIKLPDGVTLLDDADAIVLASVTQPRTEDEPETTADADAELAEGEEADGDADASGEASAEGDAGSDGEAGTTEE